MIFRPQLAAKVLSGDKTVTRRIVTSPTPIYRAGRTVAVQPGRGKFHVGHITIVKVTSEPLGHIKYGMGLDVLLEGFRGYGNLGKALDAFREYWGHLHGGWNEQTPVWRIQFSLAPSCERCVPLEVPA
jgi:hypothetical protein